MTRTVFIWSLAETSRRSRKMKSKLKISDSFLGALPAPMQDGLEDTLKQCEDDTPILKRRPSVHDFEITDKDQRVAINYASTRGIDRDKEIVVPNGVNLSHFRKAPVLLWGHQWKEPPIGSDLHIKADGYGLMAKSEFAETAKGNEVWNLVNGKHLRTSSIGFIPMKTVRNGSDNYGKVVDKLVEMWDDFTTAKADEVSAIIMTSLLLEHSLVSVPANIDALVLAVSSKELDITAKTLSELGVEIEIEDDNYDWLKDLPSDEPEDKDDDSESKDKKDDDDQKEKVESKDEEKKSPKLVARLIKAPDKVKSYTKQDLHRIVNEAVELAKGKI